MSEVGGWVPNSQIRTPTLEQLHSWSEFGSQRLAKDQAQLGQLASEDAENLRLAMQLPLSTWQNLLESLSDEQCLGLLRLFTLAEMQLPDCRRDEKSPAIACAKRLKQSGGKLDRNLLMWIRNHSDNRYLPYGPL